MVELAPVADPTLLPAAVAQALGATLSGNRNPQDEVIDVLRDRAVLLVLVVATWSYEFSYAPQSALHRGARLEG